ncbi:hypothetical protein N7478_007850 [Penicillium angulare]|uniref:uncharacterized protein n=1 Tax=Penicillium angulare TaxID=116970 RepID=UPI002541649B|nr:uncharacterized protein N7478_007850 [Penicillium angulare]KAJ5272725.1 hypothetical protein N7478_007850 [Penicillium angulare]
MAASATLANPSKTQAKQIANPRRLLILSPPYQSTSIIPQFLHSLTGVPVENPPQAGSAQASQDATPDDPGSDTPHTSQTSFAGYTTHSPLRLDTKYYTADVPVWVDEVPLLVEGDSQSTESGSESKSAPAEKTERGTGAGAAQWRAEFMSDEAQIVRDAVGALMVCVTNPGAEERTSTEPGSRPDVLALRDFMRDIGDVKGCIDEERGGVGDVPGVFVLVGAVKSGIPESKSTSTAGIGEPDELRLGLDEGLDGVEDEPFSAGWWEDQLFDCGLVGWEVIEWDPRMDGGEKTRNKYGEYEGMPRIKEVLETHDWTASGDLGALEDQDPDFGFDDEDDLESELLGFGRSSHTRGFGQEVQELEREMLGLRMAIERGGGDGEEDDAEDDGEEVKVESMEALMMRVQAIRDMGADLPENERKKFAAKAVNDLMRDL